MDLTYDDTMADLGEGFVGALVGALFTLTRVPRSREARNIHGWQGPLGLRQRRPAWRRMADPIRLTYVGHATVLIEIDGVRILTDPLLRDRIGPLRRHSPAPAARARAPSTPS